MSKRLPSLRHRCDHRAALPSAEPPQLPPATRPACLPTLPHCPAANKNAKILFLGLDNAGKTTIVKRISGEDASTVSPTLGFNIKTLEFAG